MREEAARENEASAAAELAAADSWFAELDEQERNTILEALPRAGRAILKTSVRSRHCFVYAILTVLLSISAYLLYEDGGWSALGLIPLFWSWCIFLGFEKRVENGLSCVDPFSAAVVVETMRKYAGVSGSGSLIEKD